MASVDRSLADTADADVVEASLTTVTTPDPDPAAFDLEEFLAGIRPVLRRIRIYPRGDLVAQADALADELEDLGRAHAAVVGTPAEDDAAAAFLAARERLEELRRTYQESAVEWVVQERSADWVAQTRTEFCQARGVEPQPGGAVPDDLVQEFTYHVTAEMTVTPAGVTTDTMRRLHEAAPHEFERIDAACTAALSQAGPTSWGMTADFSLRPSTTPAG
ncbi:hypothetical protein [Arsenicicoccus dermatophilus]|uniref:hypothetical protein n=1 Tax=Arsenicicoccus dermatophilus TaxID=1076331 RepID=UPI001F4CB36B|nr:hypothetical protein [Arsenicicoccus dermatophilus]MCH8613473.1 hypothetical protein [Arsenicicoccus dermatophilus]